MTNSEEHADKLVSETLQSFCKLGEEFILLNNSVMKMLPEDELSGDQCNSYESKAAVIKDFLLVTEMWIQEQISVQNEGEMLSCGVIWSGR